MPYDLTPWNRNYYIRQGHVRQTRNGALFTRFCPRTYKVRHVLLKILQLLLLVPSQWLEWDVHVASRARVASGGIWERSPNHVTNVGK